ncbi:MAG TPA: PhoH family protein [Clostridiales bacterium]|nr:PhoH family protein [Clostridiales bacterium]
MTEYININSDKMLGLFGAYDENIKLISESYGVTIRQKDNFIEISGADEAVEQAKLLMDKLCELLDKGYEISKEKVMAGIDLARLNRLDEIVSISSETIAVTSKARPIKCKTLGQKEYVDAIKNNTIVFGIGPAGTGKTYLAVALAAAAYKKREVEKIILTRPAIEAGEKLGFLPGDLQTKVDPYLRPLYDALQEMFGMDNYLRLLERGIIEVAPLAYMRGRTLSNAFIILDEAQNTTILQMKMFLTRLGNDSKVVVNGDTTQTDLPPGVTSGLFHATKILTGIKGIATVTLSSKDIVRNPLVRSIISAYDNDTKNIRGKTDERDKTNRK